MPYSVQDKNMRAEGSGLKYLIDTNILIPLEPASKLDLETNSELTREFHRLAIKAGHQLFVHPFIRQDIEQDKDIERAKLRKQLIEKYNLHMEEDK